MEVLNRKEFWMELLQGLDRLDLSTGEFAAMVSDLGINKWSLTVSPTKYLVGSLFGKPIRIVDKQPC